MNIKIYRIAGIIVSLFALYGCSNDSDQDTYGFKNKVTVCMDWGISKIEVNNYMSKYTQINTEDENILVFVDTQNSHMVSYEFIDDQLRASLLSYKTDIATDSKQFFNIDKYEYIGHADGSPVYINESQNIMCSIMDRLDDESNNNKLFGFTPINSTLYDNFEPIIVSLVEPTDISSLTARLNAKFSGVIKPGSAYFVISQSSSFETKSRYSASTSDGKFSTAISVKEPNSTIYYYAEIKCDGVWYKSETAILEMQKTKIYAIGDPYPDSNHPIGVVCSVKNYGVNGTIISLDQGWEKWDTKGIFCNDYSAYNSSDGSLNKIGTTLPFAKWVADHGTGWFGPAKNQLYFSKSDLSAINKGLSSVGGTTLNGFYWSSTQKDNNTVWVVTVSESSYIGYSNQYSFLHTKDNSNSVRAMKYF